MIDQPKWKRGDSTLATIRGVLLLAMVGFVLVIVAFLVLLWPTGSWGTNDVAFVQHFQRITSALTGEGTSNLPRRLLDVAIYLVVLVGLIFMFGAWWRGSRFALTGLLGASVLGLSYAGGMALYTAPMVTSCGFTLVLFAALLSLLSLHEEEPAAEPNTADDQPLDSGQTYLEDDVRENLHDNLIQKNDSALAADQKLS